MGGRGDRASHVTLWYRLRVRVLMPRLYGMEKGKVERVMTACCAHGGAKKPGKAPPLPDGAAPERTRAERGEAEIAEPTSTFRESCRRRKRSLCRMRFLAALVLLSLGAAGVLSRDSANSIINSTKVEPSVRNSKQSTSNLPSKKGSSLSSVNGDSGRLDEDRQSGNNIGALDQQQQLTADHNPNNSTENLQQTAQRNPDNSTENLQQTAQHHPDNSTKNSKQTTQHSPDDSAEKPQQTAQNSPDNSTNNSQQKTQQNLDNSTENQQQTEEHNPVNSTKDQQQTAQHNPVNSTKDQQQTAQDK
ncbi:PREDICTED: transcription factor mef2A-like [Condylura cristata]|uniref:transcription factor mef2A-like n=1 Tax=Condylura cristata TaxID=143302 RepID=UPI0006432E3B|nr:PREDICTED: transcription factor mef2A-like [Condylura cristata]